MPSSISVARNSSRTPYLHSSSVERLDRPNPRRALRIASHYKSTDLKVRAGCDLFRLGERGEAIYSLVDGWVALYKLMEDGGRQILQFALPGTMAFVPAQGAVMNYSAQALTDAIVSIVPHKSLGRLARECPEVGMQLAGMISLDRSLAYDQLSSSVDAQARERVAHLLLELFMRSRMRWPGHRSEEMHIPVDAGEYWRRNRAHRRARKSGASRSAQAGHPGISLSASPDHQSGQTH